MKLEFVAKGIHHSGNEASIRIPWLKEGKIHILDEQQDAKTTITIQVDNELNEWRLLVEDECVYSVLRSEQ